MSIWAHINDIELQRLREARRAVFAAEAVLAKIDEVRQERAEELHSLAGSQWKYQVHVVARAVGESYAALPPMPPTEGELRTLIAGLEQRRQEEQQNVLYCSHQFKALSKDVLRSCVGRAAAEYQGHAAALAKSWTQIATANAMLESIETQWRQIFIPALTGMTGVDPNHSAPALFTGCNPSVDAMEKVLTAMVDDQPG